MGVMCQIFLHEPPEGFYKSGDLVSGILKYAVDKDAEYKEISITLQGQGECRWRERARRNGKSRTVHRRGSEEYVNIKLEYLTKSDLVCIGSYERTFEFIVPENIPATFKDDYSEITYLLLVKFVKPGLLKFAGNRFHKVITIKDKERKISPEEPKMFGLEKTFLFSSKDKAILLKAEISNLTIAAGSLVNLKLDVTNPTSIIIPFIKADFISVTTYTANTGRTKIISDKIDGPVTPSIPDKSTSSLTLSVPTPEEFYTIKYTGIIKRDYKLRLTIQLPVPYINSHVDVDIEFVKALMNVEKAIEAVQYSKEEDKAAAPPPSYWEVMVEDMINQSTEDIDK